MLEASCHCGTVKFTVPEPPPYVMSCNCSFCRKYGLLLASYRPDQVHFISGREATIPYIQGDKTLSNHHCPICGCITHAQGLGEYADKFMKVNALLFDPAETSQWPVRHFDGADTWKFLD